jgi:hypothetical protein
MTLFSSPASPSTDVQSVTLIFRWRGQYAGFISDGWFFESGGRYLGWRDGLDRIWRADGDFLGEIVDAHYVLRDLRRAMPVRQPAPVPPVPPAPPLPPAARAPRLPKPCWEDPLEALFHVPERQELIGDWWIDGERLKLSLDGSFVWSVPGQPETTGSWEVNGRFVEIVGNGTASPGRVRYLIVSYAGDNMCWRWDTKEARSLMFTLRRGSRL